MFDNLSKATLIEVDLNPGLSQPETPTLLGITCCLNMWLGAISIKMARKVRWLQNKWSNLHFTV